MTEPTRQWISVKKSLPALVEKIDGIKDGEDMMRYSNRVLYAEGAEVGFGCYAEFDGGLKEWTDDDSGMLIRPQYWVPVPMPPTRKKKVILGKGPRRRATASGKPKRKTKRGKSDY